MKPIREFEDLDSFQKARELCKEINLVTSVRHLFTFNILFL